MLKTIGSTCPTFSQDQLGSAHSYSKARDVHSDPVKTVGPFSPYLLLAQTSPPHVATAAWLWAWSCLVTHGFRRQAWTCPASLCTSRRSEVHWKLSRWSVQHRAVSSEQCFSETASKDSRQHKMPQVRGPQRGPQMTTVWISDDISHGFTLQLLCYGLDRG